MEGVRREGRRVSFTHTTTIVTLLFPPRAESSCTASESVEEEAGKSPTHRASLREVAIRSCDCRAVISFFLALISHKILGEHVSLSPGLSALLPPQLLSHTSCPNFWICSWFRAPNKHSVNPVPSLYTPYRICWKRKQVSVKKRHGMRAKPTTDLLLIEPKIFSTVGMLVGPIQRVPEVAS